MLGAVSFSGWDTALLMAPLFALLGFWMFGLDERVAAPKRSRPRSRAFSQVEAHGEPVMTDPDGRPFKPSGTLRRPLQHTPRPPCNAPAVPARR
jgi:hypothetical protein